MGTRALPVHSLVPPLLVSLVSVIFYLVLFIRLSKPTSLSPDFFSSIISCPELSKFLILEFPERRAVSYRLEEAPPDFSLYSSYVDIVMISHEIAPISLEL